MNEILGVLPWGIFLAVVVFVLQKFFVPQILELRETLKRARYDVHYYANIYPIQSDEEKKLLNGEILKDTSKELRVVSARIRSSRDNIPLYQLVSKTKLVPEWNATEEIATSFIGWSNEIYSIEPGLSGRQLYRKKIAKALGMKSY